MRRLSVRCILLVCARGGGGKCAAFLCLKQVSAKSEGIDKRCAVAANHAECRRSSKGHRPSGRPLQRIREDLLQLAVLRRLRLGGDDGRGKVAAQQTPRVPDVAHTQFTAVCGVCLIWPTVLNAEGGCAHTHNFAQ